MCCGNWPLCLWFYFSHVLIANSSRIIVFSSGIFNYKNWQLSEYLTFCFCFLFALVTCINIFCLNLFEIVSIFVHQRKLFFFVLFPFAGHSLFWISESTRLYGHKLQWRRSWSNIHTEFRSCCSWSFTATIRHYWN